jgi:hypothetical protein
MASRKYDDFVASLRCGEEFDFSYNGHLYEIGQASDRSCSIYDHQDEKLYEFDDINGLLNFLIDGRNTLIDVIDFVDFD